MAYADKMHFTKSEYIEIKKLWLKSRKKQKRELGSEIWMYPFSQLEEYSKKEDGSIDFDNYEYQFDPADSDLDIEWMNYTDEYTVFNVSTRVELWLLKNFKLDCIKREVDRQLGEFFYQEIPEELRFNFVDKLDFSRKDRIFKIQDKDNKIFIYLFRNLEDNYIEPFDNILLYGSTKFFEYLDEAKEGIRGYKDTNLNVLFSFCGLILELKDNKIYYGDNEIVIPFIKPNYAKLNIKHSYSVKDSIKYITTPEAVFLCDDKTVYDLTSYKDNSLKRALVFLPDYLKNQIK